MGDKIIYTGSNWDNLKVGEINAANKAYKLGSLINLTRGQLDFLEDKHGDGLQSIKQSDELVKEFIKSLAQDTGVNEGQCTLELFTGGDGDDRIITK